MSKEDLKKIIPILKKSGVISAGVFGSFNKKTKKPKDIDILIELNKPLGLFKYLKLEDDLSKKLKYPVDLVTRKSLNPYLSKKILSDTKIFYER